MAEEALMVHLYGMERDGDEIPSPNMAVFSTRGMSGGAARAGEDRSFDYP